MIKNYLVITFRNFFRNRNYTLINILGLSIGITACIVLFLLITYELSFDKFHTRYDHIYRIVQQEKNPSGESGAATPYPMAKAFRNDFQDLPWATQLHYQDETLIKMGDKKLKTEDIIFADSLFFKVFDFKVLSGNPGVELGTPGKVFLTQSLANKLLNGEMNSHVTIKIDNRLELEVAGIIQDPPATSHINFSMVVSMPSLTSDFVGGLPLDHWGMTTSDYLYIVLPDQVTPQSVQARLEQFAQKYLTKEQAAKERFRLQPLSAIHFDEVYADNPGQRSNASYTDLVVMGVLGIFILMIACINFVNLATALAIKKSKEIGIRKTLGAKRRQLTAYFLGETFLLTIFSLLISLCATEWLLTWLNVFLDKHLSMNLFSNAWLSVFLMAITVFSTVLSGFYPAIILSGYNPVMVLKNKITAQGSSGAMVRKVLVVFQFFIAQVLIIGTLVIAGQMSYFRNKPLGFEKDAIINLPIPEIKKVNLESLRTRLTTNSNIKSLTFALGAPTSNNNFGTTFYLTERGKEEVFRIGVKPVDRHYLETYGITLKAGRWFTESDEKLAEDHLPMDQQEHVYIINEAAMRRLGFNTPAEVIGKFITTGVSRINAEVVGVVEDFHVTSLHEPIEPVVLINFPSFYYVAGLKLDTENFRETLHFIEKQWSEVFPEFYFEYEFMNQELAELYRQDERTFTLFKVFAGISIFIGCLGLYGLISFMANQKLKEVGIRKILGASVTSIVFLFSKEFIKLIIIAFVIAAPIAWYAMQGWLQGFAYRIDMPWSAFIISILATLAIALATVSYRAVKAAITNPTETLRTE